jgi:hypothetical protein
MDEIKFRESRVCRLLGNPVIYQLVLFLESGGPLTPSKLAKSAGRSVQTVVGISPNCVPPTWSGTTRMESRFAIGSSTSAKRANFSKRWKLSYTPRANLAEVVISTFREFPKRGSSPTGARCPTTNTALPRRDHKSRTRVFPHHDHQPSLPTASFTKFHLELNDLNGAPVLSEVEGKRLNDWNGLNELRFQTCL